MRLEVTAPEDALAGAYANFLNVWHTAHEFTLDFAATLPAEGRLQEDGSAEVVIPALVTSRVRVPPTLVFDIIRALNENMTEYEAAVRRDHPARRRRAHFSARRFDWREPRMTPRMSAPLTRRDVPVVPDSRVSYTPVPTDATTYTVTVRDEPEPARERTDVAQTMHRVMRATIERSERED